MFSKQCTPGSRLALSRDLESQARPNSGWLRRALQEVVVPSERAGAVSVAHKAHDMRTGHVSRPRSCPYDPPQKNRKRNGKKNPARGTSNTGEEGGALGKELKKDVWMCLRRLSVLLRSAAAPFNAKLLFWPIQMARKATYLANDHLS